MYIVKKYHYIGTILAQKSNNDKESIRKKSRCFSCMVKKLRFLNQKHTKKSSWNDMCLWPIYYEHRKNLDIYPSGNTNYIYKSDLDKLVVSMIWLMVKIKIWLKEQNQAKF